jgi:hypothetical protein
MNFRTEINFDPPDFLIEHTDKIFAAGSCFAENISSILTDKKFTVLSNPFGVLYNPASVFYAIQNSICLHLIQESEIAFDQSEWHSFLHDSEFSSASKSDLIEKANQSFKVTHEFLKEANVVIITFGTAKVYKHKRNNFIVSNCHKMPQTEFENFLLSVQEVKNYTQGIIDQLISFNPNLKLIFSVSPVRHFKDGFVINSKSKSTLILGIHEAISGRRNCFYFPAYEILLDDLRDYRFYKEDLLHPNESAVKYIWEKFFDSLLSVDCKKVIREINPILEAARHHVRNPKSEASQKFFIKNLAKISDVNKTYPHISFSEETEYFSMKLSQICH